MSRASANSVLRAAARALTWDLYAAAGYCRTKTPINLERFECELLSAVRHWKSVRANLAVQRRKYERTKS
jgi:hypothetical protein